MIIQRPHPLWPLPRDYHELSSEGQRMARVATVTMQRTPYELVTAWDFFRRVYLGQTKEQVFYKKGFQESPEFHFDMVYDLGAFARNAVAAPRGSAKSTVIAIEMSLMLALTRPFYDVMLGLSTDREVEKRFDQLQQQFQGNELILRDFGTMQPKRGHGIWSRHNLHCTNGASISGLSVMGKKRGGRPNLFILDDPENDPDSDSETSRLTVIQKFEMILFKQIIPMLEHGSSIFWIGTLIDRKSFLYRAVTGDDPRFDFWNRKVLRARSWNKKKKKWNILWPSKWPNEVLEARLGEIGSAAFASEYCNEPISAQDRILQIDENKNEYTVDVDSFDWHNPLVQTGLVKWAEREDKPGEIRSYTQMTKPFNEHVGPMYRILLFDHASGLGNYNDYSCVMVLGFDTTGTLWILYVWAGRAKQAALITRIYETGLAWRVRVMGIEAVGTQKDLVEVLAEKQQEEEALHGHPWRARVFPVLYPSKESKPDRIASLECRFGPGRIKYPAHLQHKWPYDQLYAQTNDFTNDLALLQHDDVIDTLAMSKYVVKTRGGKYRKERGKPGILERIRKNMPIVKGMPLLSGIPTAEVSEEMLDLLVQHKKKPDSQPHRRRIVRPRSRRINLSKGMKNGGI
ncbi:hypothetical protein LCGC14_0588560 [marine sediment metagenome]|uniref:Terminase large subunit gp17-like C-terminal domain-containing protein n=1 Tax=marine sediment metagenome TaxID=412755 RepID=A0A0F9RY27_9ZZZZ